MFKLLFMKIVKMLGLISVPNIQYDSMTGLSRLLYFINWL